MFDFQKFTDNMQPYGLGGNAYSLNPRSNSAMLYVFSPNLIPTQVLRSYQYNFTDNLIDALGNTKDKLRKVVAQPGNTNLARDVNMAILPNPNGIQLDTQTISGQWSFILIVDTTPTPSSNRLQTAAATVRTIATGYCSEEPINPVTNTINPDAILMFTKTNITTIVPHMGPAGMTTKDYCDNDLSIVDDRVNQLTGVSLVSATPRDLLRGHTYDRLTNTQICMPGDASLSNVGKGGSSKTITNVMNTPSIQLGDIVQAIGSGVSFGRNSELGTQSVLVPSPMDDPMETALDCFGNTVSGSDVVIQRGSLDGSHPRTMQQLVNEFPNMEVFRVPVPPVNCWDSSPQNVQTKRNAMSSMLSASLSNLLVSSGLASIAFRYDSYTSVMTGLTSGNEGVFYPLNYSTVVENDPAAQLRAIEQFKMLFIQHLVPIVRTYGGEFVLMCTIDIVGHILIDLIYRDEFGQNPGEGWYETSGRLGGFTNPMIADLDTFNTNATQLNTLAYNVTWNQLADVSRFGFGGRPIINSNPMDSEFTNNGTTMPASGLNPSQPLPQQEQPVSPNTLVTHQSTPVIRSGFY